MFIEEDEWNDEPTAQAPSKNILSNTTAASNPTAKVKGAGKKSLLRTLQTLGSVPDWKSDAPQGDSDSETEAVQPHTKRKHKRKRPKQTAGTVEEVGSKELHDGGMQKKNVAKKLKKKNAKPRSHKTDNTDSVKAVDKETPKAQGAEVKPEDETNRMSRKQWKAKMKNKRKCKNKYRLNKSEQEVTIAATTEKHNPKEQLPVDSPSNISESVNQVAALKRKIECIKEEKELSSADKQTHKKEARSKKLKKDNPVEAAKLKSSGQETKQEVEETQALKSGRQVQQNAPSKRLKLEESKLQNQKREKLRNLLHSLSPDEPEVPTEERDEDKVTTEKEDVTEASADKSASLRSRMEQRLDSARFRYINEVLYTSSSGEAKRMFQQDPQAFGIYHRGFTAQVQRWPNNPVDAIIAYIRNKPASLVVADFGCGDCKIARSVKNKVYSFDLAPVCDLVTVCDMAHVPLGKKSVDIAVFCLALMGTNLGDFLAEANRVLVMGGVLKIAEVASRFNDVRSFLTAMANLGFQLKSKDTENSHFYLFDFVKIQDAEENAKKFRLQLNPCVYKKR